MSSYNIRRQTLALPTRAELSYSSRLQNSFVVRALTNSLSIPKSISQSSNTSLYQPHDFSSSKDKLASKSAIYAALAGLKPPLPFKMPIFYDDHRPKINKAEFAVDTSEQASMVNSSSKEKTINEKATEFDEASAEWKDSVIYHFELVNTYAAQIDGFKANAQSILKENRVSTDKYEESIQFLLNERGHIASELFLEMQELKILIHSSSLKNESDKMQLSSILDTVIGMQAQLQKIMFWILNDFSSIDLSEEEKHFSKKAGYFCNEFIEIDKKIDACIFEQSAKELDQSISQIREYKSQVAQNLQLEIDDLKQHLSQTQSNDNLSRILARMNTIYNQLENMLPVPAAPSF